MSFKTTPKAPFTVRIAYISILMLTVTFWVVLVSSNMWYTKNSVLNDIKSKYPEISNVLQINRNLLSYSEIIVQEGEKINTYYLDSNLFFDYKFHKKESGANT